jgi:hypothetical protein
MRWFASKRFFRKVGTIVWAHSFYMFPLFVVGAVLRGLCISFGATFCFFGASHFFNPHLHSFGSQTIHLIILSFHLPSPMDPFHAFVGCRKSGLSNMVTPVPHHGKTGSRAAMHGSMTLSVAILAQFIVAQATFRDLRSDGNVA